MVEQNKPVRSRDEQIGAIANDWIAEGMGPDIAHERSAQMILEAEARGAAEERRKDGDEQELVAWLVNQKGVDAPFFTQNIHATKSEFVTSLTPLYTHPASVAALEDRVRELEGALKEIIDTAGADCIHGLGPYIKIATAALTRTGTPS